MHIKSLAAAASCSAVAETPAGGPIVIKFSHVVAMATPKGQAAQRFKATAEMTKGRVRLEVYPNSALYKDKEELQACNWAPCRCWRRRLPGAVRWA